MEKLNILKLNFDTKRIYGLDVLRAIAILFVVFEHSVSIMPPHIYSIINYFYLDGVVIFFVLSGFLIGTILIKSIEKNGFNTSELLIFWTRRWFRTLPNYYLFLIILTILSKLIITGFPLRMVIPYVFFSQNLFNGIERSFFGESWSLCVEEWFYLTIPLIIFLLIKPLKLSFQKSILFLSLAIIFSSILMRLSLYNYEIIQELRDYTRIVVIRLDNIIYGVVGAYVSFYHKYFWQKHIKSSLIIGIFLIIIWRYYSFNDPSQISFFRVNIYYPLLCVGILLLLPFLSNYNVAKHNTITKFFTYISLISYSLYLIHNSLIRKLIIESLLFTSEDSTPQITFIKIAFYWSSSLIGALLIYKYFEIPTMKLRDKIKLK